ncbi:FAD-binding protein [Roseivivax sp. THAF30]|uniref:FAD-binding protein n=1 Tax=Roseivivax sp. THAF30 TaxID=2587852 RepID=UPI0012683866|nr:FAD-binding protein [Roseivivax sp. THAF30]QFT61404.1 putative FAD-linked oxidoreductase [Roseivivax sp. THAF30]
MRPGSEQEMSEAIRAASGPVRIVGGGTRGGFGTGEVIETGGLSGITLYEPGALTLVARAGTPLSEIEDALARENQRLAFEPMDHRALLGTRGKPTLGGVAAGNISGPRRIQAGAARDFMLGVRFVDGNGTIVKNGGRVMKNVTGYDLVKLMAGSWGQLGVLTEISLKVLPVPEMQATLVLHGLNDRDAVAAMSRALGSPYEVTGAAHLPASGRTCLRIEGFERSVQYRLEALGQLFAEAAQDRIVDSAENAILWQAIRDAEHLAESAGNIWRISVKPSEGPVVAERLGAKAHFFDWGGGLVWACLRRGDDARHALTGISGHATLVRADPADLAKLPRFQPEPPAIAKLTDGLRRKFDPRGLFRSEPVTA